MDVADAFLAGLLGEWIEPVEHEGPTGQHVERGHGGTLGRTVEGVSDVYEFVVLGLLVAGVLAFAVWAFRNRPSSRTPLVMDRDAEIGSAQVRARNDHSGL